MASQTSLCILLLKTKFFANVRKLPFLFYAVTIILLFCNHNYNKKVSAKIHVAILQHNHAQVVTMSCMHNCKLLYASLYNCSCSYISVCNL